MRPLIEAFFQRPPDSCGAIYNERSLQLELAYYFRQVGAHVEFERPYRITPLPGATCKAKSNLDLIVQMDGETVAMELKVPLNGRHPETLYDFCNDIAFVEAIVQEKFANRGFCLFVTNDRTFWTDSGRGSPVHDLFRRKGTELSGAVQKSTGGKDTAVVILGMPHMADDPNRYRDDVELLAHHFTDAVQGISILRTHPLGLGKIAGHGDARQCR